jgi:hypothetical protein
MPTLRLSGLYDPFIHVRVAGVDVPHRGLHVGVTGNTVEGERVHPFRPMGQARVAQYVELEAGYPAYLGSFGVLLG